MKQNIFTPPYELNSVEQILIAQQAGFLNLGEDYEKLLEFARHNKLIAPSALIAAQQSAVIKEEKISQCALICEQGVRLEPYRDFEQVWKALPNIETIIRHETLFQFSQTLPQAVRDECLQNGVMHLGWIIALQELIKRECISYVAAKKVRYMKNLEQLKTLIVAYALFLPENEDVLQSLRRSAEHAKGQGLWERALKELLFVRLHDYMLRLCVIGPDIVRRRFLSGIARLALTGRQRACLYGYYTPGSSNDHAMAILDKIVKVSRRLLDQDTQVKLQALVLSLKETIADVGNLYWKLFCNGDLETMRRCHVPQPLQRENTSYEESIIQTCTRVQDFTLPTYSNLRDITLWPTKDYLDWHRGSSRDCTMKYGLNEQHLKTPSFFNIRMFSGPAWFGNIYMLDLEAHQTLLVDKIQIPAQGFKALSSKFFTLLQESFETLFADVPYHRILLPRRISNHKIVQKAWDSFKLNLEKCELEHTYSFAKYFESLRKGPDTMHYYIFLKKPLVVQVSPLQTAWCQV